MALKTLFVHDGLLGGLHNEAAEAKEPLGQITVSESSHVAAPSQDGGQRGVEQEEGHL